MQVERIKLINFRNYAQLDLRGFSDGINVIHGDNAQGKTNLIESIAVCANGKSFRPGAESSLVKNDAVNAYIRIDYEDKGISKSLETVIDTDRRKSYKKNGVAARSIKEILGSLLTVSFAPEDIRIVREGPGLRRNLLDGEISKIRPAYVDALRSYARILSEKNRVLKRPDAPHAAELISVYNAQAAPCIRTIVHNRHKYIEKLNTYVSQVHREISGRDEHIEIEYRATIAEDNVEEQLRNLLPREKAAFASVAGPQRDDIVFRLNGRDVKSYASQGQQRTLMLAVKIACMRILRDVTGSTPIFLLDDVLSELDEDRKRNLLRMMEGQQVFITSADNADTEMIRGQKRIRVKDGKALVEQ